MTFRLSGHRAMSGLGLLLRLSRRVSDVGPLTTSSCTWLHEHLFARHELDEIVVIGAPQKAATTHLETLHCRIKVPWRIRALMPIATLPCVLEKRSRLSLKSQKDYSSSKKDRARGAAGISNGPDFDSAPVRAAKSVPCLGFMPCSVPIGRALCRDR